MLTTSQPQSEDLENEAGVVSGFIRPGWLSQFPVPRPLTGMVVEVRD